MKKLLPGRLKEARKRNKLTQEELARKVKTTKGTISNYENEHSAPSNDMLNDLADVLGVTTDYLLGRTDQPDGIQKKIIKHEQEDELEALLNDPNTGLWAKEWSKTSVEKRRQALDFLRYLNEQEQGRKPGDKQK